jgi:hypothetical protein
MSIPTLIVLLIALVLGLAIALGLAYVPMRLLLGRMAAGVTSFIQRQRDRRAVARQTPDRRN